MAQVVHIFHDYCAIRYDLRPQLGQSLVEGLACLVDGLLLGLGLSQIRGLSHGSRCLGICNQAVHLQRLQVGIEAGVDGLSEGNQAIQGGMIRLISLGAAACLTVEIHIIVVLAAGGIPGRQEALAVGGLVAASVRIHIQAIAVGAGSIYIISIGPGTGGQGQGCIGTGKANIILTIDTQASLSIGSRDRISTIGSRDIPQVILAVQGGDIYGPC